MARIVLDASAAVELLSNTELGTDGCYVALAERLDAPLATVDMKLVNATGLPIRTIHP